MDVATASPSSVVLVSGLVGGPEGGTGWRGRPAGIRSGRWARLLRGLHHRRKLADLGRPPWLDKGSRRGAEPARCPRRGTGGCSRRRAPRSCCGSASSRSRSPTRFGSRLGPKPPARRPVRPHPPPTLSATLPGCCCSIEQLTPVAAVGLAVSRSGLSQTRRAAAPRSVIAPPAGRSSPALRDRRLRTAAAAQPPQLGV